MFSNKGFTLIEIICVIVILAIVFLVGSRILGHLISSYVTTENITSASWQGRIPTERMTREIRTIRNPMSISVMKSNKIQFVTNDGALISYSYNKKQKRLYRQTVTPFESNAVLTDGLKYARFTYYDVNGNTTKKKSKVYYIGINLGIKNDNVDQDFKQIVFPRNFR